MKAKAGGLWCPGGAGRQRGREGGRGRPEPRSPDPGSLGTPASGNRKLSRTSTGNGMAELRPGEATKVSGLGAGLRSGPRRKHSPASHCSSQADTSHRSAPDTRRLAAGKRAVMPGCCASLARPPARPPVAWGYLGRHVHEQHGSDGRLGLAVALLGSVQRVGLQHPEQFLLAAER